MSSTSAQTEGKARRAARKSGRRKAGCAAARSAPDGFPSPDHHLSLLRQMLTIRRFEERCVELYSSTKIRGFVHLYIGEEAVAVGVNQALGEKDAAVSTYREHGHALARGVLAEAVMAEMYGKATGCSRGRGGSRHLFDAGRRFYGGNAIVARRSRGR